MYKFTLTSVPMLSALMGEKKVFIFKYGPHFCRNVSKFKTKE